MPARCPTGPILVSLLLASIGLPCAPALSHPLPIEHDGVVELEAGFDSFQVLDSYDGFLRGSTGEFMFIVPSLYEEGHKEASGELDKLVENVSGGFIYCLEPPMREQDADGGCILQTVFNHRQCHPPRTLHVQLRVWEDDGDSETMAAIRALLKQSARVATGAADEIAASLTDQILEISGLREVVDEWLKGLEEEIRDQLGDDVGAIVNLIVSLAIDRALEGGYDAADEVLVELSEPVRGEVDGLGQKLGLTDQARQRLLEGGHSILDWALDGVIDILIGAGNDPVGSYEGPLLEDWHPEARQARYGGNLHTGNFDLSEATGAALKFFVTANQSGGRFGEVASGTTVCPRPVERQIPLAPIEVGPRDEVGKKTLGEKATEQVVGGVLGRVFGGGSRRSSRREGPRTRRDPTRKLDYTEIGKPELDLAAEARSRWTDDGLLVSTRIAESDDKGTFQTIFLQDCRARRLYPSRIEIYDLWAEHRLTVSWSRTTTVNGRVTSHETGGWTDTWTEDLGKFTRSSQEQEQSMPPIWKALGYDRAQAGVRQLGAYFDVEPGEAAGLGELALVTHITRPGQDPVITEPFNWILDPGSGDQPEVVHPDTPVTPADRDVSDWQVFTGDEPETKPDDPDLVSEPRIVADPEAPPEEAAERETTVWEEWQEHCRRDNPTQVQDGPGVPNTVGSAGEEVEYKRRPIERDDCVEEKGQLEVLRSRLKNAVEDVENHLDRAIEAVEAESERVHEAGEASAQEEATEAVERQADRELEEHDRRREDQERAYSDAIEEGQQEGDPALVERMREGRERMRRRYTEDRKPLKAQTQERQRAHDQAEQKLQQAAVEVAQAAQESRQTTQALGQALAAAQQAKDALMTFAVSNLECFPCETFRGLAADVDGLDVLLHDLRDRLTAALERARAEETTARPDAEEAEKKLREHDEKIEQKEGELAELEEALRRMLPNIEDLGSNPAAGSHKIGLLPGTDIKLHFAENRVGILQRFLRSSTFQGVRRDHSKVREDLQKLSAERVDLARRNGMAQARLEGIERRIERLQQLREIVDGAGVEDNVRTALDRLTDARTECLAQVKECFRAVQERRRQLRERLNELGKAKTELQSRRMKASRLHDRVDANESEIGVEALDERIEELNQRLHEIEQDLDRTLSDLSEAPEAPPSGDHRTVVDCRRDGRALEDTLAETERAIERAESASEQAATETSEVEDDLSEVEEAADDILDHRRRVRAYRKCLEKKRRALERLQEIYRSRAGEESELLTELQERVGEVSDEVADLEDLAELGRRIDSIGDVAGELEEIAGDLGQALEGLGSLINAAEFLHQLFRDSATMTPAEQAAIFAKGYELLNDLLPDVGGIQPFVDFYGQALTAIAEAIDGIQRKLIAGWLRSGLPLETIEDMVLNEALRAEIRRAYEIRKLLKILERRCESHLR